MLRSPVRAAIAAPLLVLTLAPVAAAHAELRSATPGPGDKVVLALLGQMPPMSFRAVTIVSASVPPYAAYLPRQDAFGLDSLARHEENEAKRVDTRLVRARAVAPKES